MRRYLPFLLVCLTFLAGYYFWGINRGLENEYRDGPPHRPAPTEKPHAPAPPRPSPFPTTITLLPTASSATSLHSESTTAEGDLSLIQSLLRSHRSALGSNPVGLNDEITAALTGKNAKGAASISPDHPSISAKGELLDRWGTPYRFHAYSGKMMEVRSAGPDQKFFTTDDVTLSE